MESIQNISMDIMDNHLYEPVYSKQYDTMRVLSITITSDCNPVDLTGCNASFQMKKSDDTVILKKCTITDNIVTVNLDRNITVFYGNRLPFQIQIVNADAEVISTTTGYLNIEKSAVQAEDVESSSDFSTFVDILVEITKKYNETKECADNAKQSEINAKESETNAKQSELNASTSEINAKASETKAKTSETNAKSSENSAKEYSDQAKTSADNAATSESNAKVSENNASTYYTKAKECADNAKTSETNAAASETNAESYAVGKTDSAKYYYEQAKTISESFAGALRPMGTITFSELPNNASSGDMYNISDEFTTTDNFKEGAGNVIPAGSNIYRTADSYWDVLAGTPVSGVKGNKEDSYRTGNVNITPVNIGAVSTDGDTITGDLTVNGTIDGSAVTSSVTSKSTALLTSGGAYTNLARLNSSNTFQGGLYLNSPNETATTQRLFAIYDYNSKGETPIGSTGSGNPALRRLMATIAPSTHMGYIGLYNDTESKYEGGFKFDRTSITVLGQSVDPTSSVGASVQHPTVNMNSGYITNVSTINGYSLGATTASSGSTSLITSGGVYSYAFPKAGGYVDGNISPSSNNDNVLGTTDHYWGKLRCNMWESSGTPYWRSGANNQSCIVKSAGLYSLTRNSSDTAASFTYAPMYASAFNQKSSKRYKDHKGYVTDEQARVILDLEPVVYDYKNKDNGTDCEGLYAEDVYDKVPYCVTLDAENKPDSIDYSRLVPRMIKMIQVQQEQIDNMQKEINLLKDKLAL